MLYDKRTKHGKRTTTLKLVDDVNINIHGIALNATETTAINGKATTQAIPSAVDEFSAAIRDIARDVAAATDFSASDKVQGQSANKPAHGPATRADNTGKVVHLINDIAEKTAEKTAEKPVNESQSLSEQSDVLRNELDKILATMRSS